MRGEKGEVERRGRSGERGDINGGEKMGGGGENSEEVGLANLNYRR